MVDERTNDERCTHALDGEKVRKTEFLRHLIIYARIDAQRPFF